MLRKRAVFKPNLSQASGPKPPQPTQPPASGPNPSQGPDGPTPTSDRPPSPVKAAPHVEVDRSSDANESNSVTTISTVSAIQPTEQPSTISTSNSKEIDDESNKRVHEAIEQLTGQRFEPIKSVNLQNSANKNKNVKLRDLLFYNPPLTRDQKRHRKNAKKKQDELKSSSVEAEDDGPVEDPSLVPRVKIGQDGKLILDESSTIINRKNLIKEKEAIIEDNEEIISKTNYDSYRRKPASSSQTKWSSDETQLFYRALTIFGTDFSMMEALLFSGHRTRTELHKKFKREEKSNKNKIDIALSSRISLDSEELLELRERFFPTWKSHERG